MRARTPLSKIKGYMDAIQNKDALKLYEIGFDFLTDKNYASAFPCLEAAAELGHAKANLELSTLHGSGLGTEVNTELAQQYSAKHSQFDDAEANLFVAKAALRQQDNLKAKKYFEIILINNPYHLEALKKLGLMYEFGKGVESDHRIACQYYQRYCSITADNREVDAWIHSADNREVKAWIRWLNRVPQDEIPGFNEVKNDANKMLGLSLKLDEQGLLRASLACIEHAASLKSAIAFNNLAVIRANDHLDEKNSTLDVVDCFNQALALDSLPEIMTNYALYLYNLGEYTKAVKLFELAANKGYRFASRLLTNINCNNNNVGFTKNLITACDYYIGRFRNASVKNPLIRVLDKIRINPGPPVSVYNFSYAYIVQLDEMRYNGKSTQALEVIARGMHDKDIGLNSFYKFFLSGMKELYQTDVDANKAIEAFENARKWATEPSQHANVSWKLAILHLRIPNHMTETISEYMQAYANASELPCTRKFIIEELEQLSNTHRFKDIFVKFCYKEAAAWIDSGNFEVAKIFIEKLTVLPDFDLLPNALAILSRYAFILSQNEKTHQAAFDVLSELANSKHLVSQAKIACAHLNGDFGQPVNIPLGLKLFNDFISPVEMENDDKKECDDTQVWEENRLLTTILVQELIKLKIKIPHENLPELYSVMYRLLISPWISKTSEDAFVLAKALINSQNEDHGKLAEKLLGELTPRFVESFNMQTVEYLADTFKKNKIVLPLFFLNVMAYICSNTEGDLEKCIRTQQSLAVDSDNAEFVLVKKFFICCFSDKGSLYYIPNLKDVFKVTHPAVVILLAYYQAARNGIILGGSVQGEDGKNNDQLIVNMKNSIENNIKLILQEHSALPPALIDEMYLALKSEAFNLLNHISVAKNTESALPESVVLIESPYITTDKPLIPVRNSHADFIFNAVYSKKYESINTGKFFWPNKYGSKRAICLDLGKQLLKFLNIEKQFKFELDVVTIHEFNNNQALNIAIKDSYPMYYDYLVKQISQQAKVKVVLLEEKEDAPDSYNRMSLN